MPTEGVTSPDGGRIHLFSFWYDQEATAVVSILLGLFQLILSVPLGFSHLTLPYIFILPLVSGILIVVGGSFIMANERNPSRLLLQGSACSNLVGLLSALISFCLYCYSLSIKDNHEQCSLLPEDYNYPRECPIDALLAYSWSVTVMLLLYNFGAVVLHIVFSVFSLKALKTD
ncbi:uncharacterized protein [Nerophis lumbriciformis]|uniref:uncharacterized protein n=1 Tax=Nerophis lumbriciformis TaxID=546530 RepID=UPI002ADF930E|nr:uncharacterized protein si:dkey-9i23.16 [Nerophis lumbriciformis]XP_061844335.1 uncharacterized protein si:dkey-9i23.16 [Nerophis lumbriciformis]